MNTQRRSLLLATMLLVCALFACKGIGKKKGEKMGVGHATSDGTWIVVSATDMGKSLAPVPAFSTFPPRTTTGRFVKLHVRARPRNEAFSVMYAPMIVDSQGREHKPLDDYKYVEGDSALDVAVDQFGEIKPVYELPADAKDLQAKLAGNHNEDGIPVMVDLDL